MWLHSTGFVLRESMRLVWMSPRTIYKTTTQTHIRSNFIVYSNSSIFISFFFSLSNLQTTYKILTKIQAKTKMLVWMDLAQVANIANQIRIRPNDMNRKYHWNWWWIREALFKMFIAQAIRSTKTVACFRQTNVLNSLVLCTQTHQKEKVCITPKNNRSLHSNC